MADVIDLRENDPAKRVDGRYQPRHPASYVPAPIPPRGWHRVYQLPLVQRFLTKHFHRTYYYGMADTILTTSWLGVPTLKCPLDLWVLQEIVTDVRPSVIVELGTYRGGSALFLADLCERLGRGRVLTVDLVPPVTPLPDHDRITYVHGSSIAAETVARVHDDLGERGPVIVLLDSNHTRDHVLAELRLYADLVTVGSYLIVEDTNVNGHPVLPGFGPGPTEAIAEFLRDDDRFEVDRSRERFLLTMHPGGFLERVR